jgi:hypothetical protein
MLDQLKWVSSKKHLDDRASVRGIAGFVEGYRSRERSVSLPECVKFTSTS